MIIKIISGGQTGADQGGVHAGKTLGLETGGFAPKYYKTDEGSMQYLLQAYGLLEDTSPSYPPRTKKNVANSDGTALFGNTTSPGTRLTINYCRSLNKPYIINPTSEELRKWTSDLNIKILNVAGNRERTNPGIHIKTYNTIVEAFKNEIT